MISDCELQLLQTAEAAGLVETGRSYPALENLLAQATRRYEAATDDEVWTTHFLIWRSLHETKMERLGQATENITM